MKFRLSIPSPPGGRHTVVLGEGHNCFEGLGDVLAEISQEMSVMMLFGI